MKLQLQGTRLKSNIAMVLGALYVPIVVVFAVQSKAGDGIVTFYTPFVLWFLASIGLGARFGSWWALLLAVIAGPLVTSGAALIVGKPGEVFELSEATIMISLTWLVGLAVGVLMRKVTGLWGFTW